MKKIISTFLLSLTLSACSMTPTGPAEDKWDEEEKADRVKIGSLLGGKKSEDRENAELKARLEKLERQQNTGSAAPTYTDTGNKQGSNDITAPPVYRNQPSTPSVDPAWQSSASYAEWKRARENKSGDYKEFKEYQEWVEFQKMKKK